MPQRRITTAFTLTSEPSPAECHAPLGMMKSGCSPMLAVSQSPPTWTGAADRNDPAKALNGYKRCHDMRRQEGCDVLRGPVAYDDVRRRGHHRRCHIPAFLGCQVHQWPVSFRHWAVLLPGLLFGRRHCGTARYCRVGPSRPVPQPTKATPQCENYVVRCWISTTKKKT